MDYNHRPGSFKRSREASSNAASNQNDKDARPSKRNNSPRNSISIFDSPSSSSIVTTPKKSTRHLLGKKNRILTSFKNAFSSSSSAKTPYQSPTSDEEQSGSASPTDSSSIVSSPTCQSSDLSYTESAFNFYTPPSASCEHSPIQISKREKPCRLLNFNDDLYSIQLSNLSITGGHQQPQPHAIFHIPEIVSKIISYVDCEPSLPHEESPTRRRPLSYQHALLIYKDERKAQSVWREACESSLKNNGNPSSSMNFTSKRSNSLHSCLLVNKLWYQVTLEIASNKLFFAGERKWLNFVDNTRKKPRRTVSNTSLFIMHKITKAKQQDLEIIAPSVSGQLEWIEMYICPKILPPPIMLSGSLLKKLILPGSKVVNDYFLGLVAQNAPKLEILDLRACELVSDQGICIIAQNCPNLTNLNLGRHSNGHLITDDSLVVLSRNTRIETLGMAGCAITDRGIWDLAYHCSDSITRLSLNNCELLTNNSIPRAMKDGFFSKLAVLEIRKILNITNFEPLVTFKKMKEINGLNVLIEGCEILEYRMREEEWRHEMRRSAKILNDILLWANNPEDGDIPYAQLASK